MAPTGDARGSIGSVRYYQIASRRDHTRDLMSSPAAALHGNAETRRIVSGSSLLVLTLSLLDLVGWWAHIPLLTSVLPGYATMKPNTALCLGLLSLAFILELNRGRPAWPQAAAA